MEATSPAGTYALIDRYEIPKGFRSSLKEKIRTSLASVRELIDRNNDACMAEIVVDPEVMKKQAKAAEIPLSALLDALALEFIKLVFVGIFVFIGSTYLYQIAKKLSGGIDPESLNTYVSIMLPLFCIMLPVSIIWASFNGIGLIMDIIQIFRVIFGKKVLGSTIIFTSTLEYAGAIGNKGIYCSPARGHGQQAFVPWNEIEYVELTTRGTWQALVLRGSEDRQLLAFRAPYADGMNAASIYDLIHEKRLEASKAL